MIFPGPWLNPATVHPTRLAVVQWALARILVVENQGPNRSGLIDQWNTAAGAPIASSWCASFAFSAWKENGAAPLGNAACDTWHVNSAKAGRFLTSGNVGDVMLFDFSTQAGYADHCGVLVRQEIIDGVSYVYSAEGNTNTNGSREGDGVYVHRWLTTNPQILGYVSLGL